MWTHPAWGGRHLPDVRSGQELAAYASTFGAVEGNTTFYATPTRTVASGWATSIPDDFRFVAKFPRRVTHERRLRHTEEDVRAFLDAMEPLHAHLAPIAIQLPASFEPESLGVLDGFLSQLPSDITAAVEVRAHGWFEERAERSLNDVLHRHGANRITLDSRALFAGPAETPGEIEAFERKPRVPVRAVATAQTPVVRFIGQTDLDANEQFLQPWVDTVARWLRDGRDPIVFLHTPDNADAPELCRRFHASVRRLLPGIEPLPDPPQRPQSALFDDPDNS